MHLKYCSHNDNVIIIDVIIEWSLLDDIYNTLTEYMGDFESR